MRDPQAYLRHPRGRGRIFGDAEVHRSAYLSEDSTAANECQLRDCVVKDSSTVGERARIFGGNIIRSMISADVVIAGDPFITESVIRGKSISGKPDLYRVIFYGGAEIAGTPIISGIGRHGILINEHALVYGDAVLEGNFTINGNMRVATGRWERAPRYRDLGFVSVTESKLGAMVDCRDRTESYWTLHGPKLARRWGWSEKQIAETLLAVRYVVNG